MPGARRSLRCVWVQAERSTGAAAHQGALATGAYGLGFSMKAQSMLARGACIPGDSGCTNQEGNYQICKQHGSTLAFSHFFAGLSGHLMGGHQWAVRGRALDQEPCSRHAHALLQPGKDGSRGAGAVSGACLTRKHLIHYVRPHKGLNGIR